MDLRIFHEVLDVARERVVNRPAAGRVVAVPFRHVLLLDALRGTPGPRVPLIVQQRKVALLRVLLAGFLRAAQKKN